MSQAMNILNQLESVFDGKQAKVLANVLLEREELSLKDLVTKEYLTSELNDMKSLFYKEMGDLKDDLRKEMGDLKDDLRKEMGDLKDDLHKEMNNLKDELRKDMGDLKNDLRKEIGDLKDDVNKRFDIVNERMLELNKTIIRQTWVYLGGIAFLVSVLTLVLKIIK